MLAEVAAPPDSATGAPDTVPLTRNCTVPVGEASEVAEAVNVAAAVIVCEVAIAVPVAEIVSEVLTGTAAWMKFATSSEPHPVA